MFPISTAQLNLHRLPREMFTLASSQAGQQQWSSYWCSSKLSIYLYNSRNIQKRLFSARICHFTPRFYWPSFYLYFMQLRTCHIFQNGALFFWQVISKSFYFLDFLSWNGPIQLQLQLGNESKCLDLCVVMEVIVKRVISNHKDREHIAKHHWWSVHSIRTWCSSNLTNYQQKVSD